MKIITAILFTITFAGCITEKKVNRWLNDHPTAAAGYCADKFPPDTTSQVITGAVDTGAYHTAYSQLASYADSLFLQLKKQRSEYKPTPDQPCPPSVNIDSLRKVVDAEIRKRLTPCKDSIQRIINTVIDRAREKQLQGKLDEKDATISIRDKRISELEAQVKGLKKWPWLFWLMVVLIGGYTLLKLRGKLPF